MKILLITQWFAPVKSAASNRTSKMARFLRKQGHQVTVLTGLPSYPTGVLPKKYHWKLFYKEKIDHIDILRTYEFPSPNKGTAKRLFNNFTFLFSALIAVLIIPKRDVVIVSSPPFLSGIVGLLAKLIWRAKFIFDVRDLWPDSAIELGFVKQKWLKTALEKLEKRYYRQADKILVATPSIKKHLVGENINPDKITVLLNSVDTDIFKPMTINRTKYGFAQSDFIVCYTGNHSKLYGLQTVLKAAFILKNNIKIKFILVGEGEEKANLLNLKTELKLTNVAFISERPSKEVSQLINLSDITLIPLTNIKVAQESIPMKTSEYLACGKPIIASIGGDTKKMLEKHQAGIIYRSGDEKMLAQAIIKLYKNPALIKKMSQNARQLALKNFSDKKFGNTLNNITN